MLFSRIDYQSNLQELLPNFDKLLNIAQFHIGLKE